MKVKILKCSNNIFWYNNRIGEEFDAIENDGRNILDWSDWKYLVNVDGSKSFGSGVKAEDCEVVEEQFFGLEEAYSGPVAASYDKTYYTRPATKLDAPKKQSVHQLAAETFSALSGKPLSENDVKIIVELVEVMEKL